MSKDDKFVFEVMDYTNDDSYYPMGVFETLDLAIAAIENAEDEESSIYWNGNEQYEKISVIKRRLNGWDDGGIKVWSLERVQKYNEDKDELFWIRSRVTEGPQ